MNLYTEENQVLKNLKKKLQENESIITKADKGEMVVIFKEKDNNDKVNDFLPNNDISEIKKDPTEDYVKDINQNINLCDKIFDDRTRRYLKPIKASAPVFNGLIKLHKK